MKKILFLFLVLSAAFRIQKQIDAYEKVYPNLKIHDPAYPNADVLRRKDALLIL